MIFIIYILAGRKPLKQNIKNTNSTHMESISSIAANRYLIKLQKNAFYCECSLVEAYSRFQSNSGKELDISFSTFYKYVGNEFKKPHRFSDLCEYCEQYKVKKYFFQ